MQTLNRPEETERPDGDFDDSEWEAKWHAPTAADDLGHQEGLGGPLSNENEDTHASAANSINPDELSHMEAAGAISDQVGQGYNEANTKAGQGAVQRISGTFAAHKKGFLIGGAGGGTLATLTIIGFFALIPLKVDNLVENVQNKFMASSDQAVQNETKNLFSSYVAKFLLPGMRSNKQCSSTLIDNNCVAVPSGSSPFDKLAAAWQQGKVEQKLAAQGIEFKKVGNKIYMKTPGLTGDGADVTNFGKDGEEDLFKLLGTTSGARQGFQEAQQALINGLENATLYNRTLIRYQLGRYAEEKDGVKRCVIACAAKDNFTDKVTSKKEAAQAYILERVVLPRAQNTGIAIQCFLNINCHPDQPTGNDGNVGDATNGEQMSDTTKDMKNSMDEAAASFGAKTLDQIAADTINEIKDKYGGSVQDYVVDQVLSKMFGETATKETVAKFIPIVGWVNFAAEAEGNVSQDSGKLKALNYGIDSTATVDLYMTYRTVADESRSGHMDATELGSFADSLGTGTSSATATAESTPLYQSVIDKSSTPSNAGTYRCDNKQRVPQGKLICNEEDLRPQNGLIAALQGVQNIIPAAIRPELDLLASFWNSTIGQVSGTISGLACETPGISFLCDELSSAVAAVAQPLFTWVATELFPMPFDQNSSGGRLSDMVIAGGDVLGNSVAHHSLGAQKITSGQFASIVGQQEQQQEYAFQQQSTFARIFGSDSHSLASHLADVMPTSLETFFTSDIGSLLSNPLGKLSSGFGSIFSGTASAQSADAATMCPGPFGVTCYGYPVDDPVFSTDPDTYWQQHNCDQDVTSGFSAYNNNYQMNPDTEQPENDTTDGCMLMQAAIGDAGAVYDAGLLTQDEQADSGGTLSNPSGNTTLTSSTDPSKAGMVWPEGQASATITQCFKPPSNPSHPGIDIAGAEGTPIYAAAAGTVTWAGPISGYGNNFVAITDDTGGYGSSYGHMNSMSVTKGQHVSQGQQIGTEGNEGESSGPHLHFNVYPGAYSGSDAPNVDPVPFLTIPSGVSNPNNCS